jgi:hypothetical protein
VRWVKIETNLLAFQASEYGRIEKSNNVASSSALFEYGVPV